MPVLIAYVFVVLIWGTTPLAIVWSNGTGHFTVAVLSRMLLALLVALMINAVLGRRLFDRPGASHVYFIASIGLFPNMPLVYYSAQFIPSGLIAVLFALSPFVTGVLSMIILKDNPFNRRRLCALVLAVLGLAVIFRSQLALDSDAAIGIVGILGSCVLFSSSSVLLKARRTSVDAFNQTTGALLFAMPGLITFWWLAGAPMPQLPTQAVAAVVYLALCGSLLGFTLFFFVLSRLSPSVVSLITLMTPILALGSGALLAGERLSVEAAVGTVLVFLALIMYLDVVAFLRRPKLT
ncbi:DMT family transporter [Gilvimarinus polysaccharolyticus]|uniref:DMT family transporter n=1 Tax=Gilvimarinus polysaccharolyticus TaxID=863921 RepID=UPI00067387B2|nr:DMT family transporter [Gilvimarinus polysaccharolyticus]